MADLTPADPFGSPPDPPTDLAGQDRSSAPLPVPLTSFVGREREIAHVGHLLHRPDVRLVTLTGPGGVGKTRLALRVAEEVASGFANGVAFVSLAAITDPVLVLPTVAHALSVREAGDRSLVEGLTDTLRHQKLLLVLDNLEHVLDATPLVTTLLTACPGLVVLATSRAVLRLSGEHDVTVPPLPLPDLGQVGTPAMAITSDAVRLFVSRAQASFADFSLTPANVAAVIEICRRVDGLPLALELAAAHTKILSPAGLLARLERHHPLLIGGTRDAPERQRTMRDTIAWSHDLLSSDERWLFRHLAVFAGGFTFEAVEAVGRIDGTNQRDLLGLVSSLVDLSLVWREDTPENDVRFGMLETIRAFAMDFLVCSGEEEAARQALTDYLQEIVASFRVKIEGAERAATIGAMTRELDNVRAALAWAIERGEADIAQHIAGYLGPFWMDRGLIREALDWLDRALHLPGASVHSRVEALYWAGFFALWQDDLTRAERHGDEAIALSHADGHDWGIVVSLNLLAAIAATLDDPDLARRRYEEAIGRVRAMTDPPWARASYALLLDAMGGLAE